MSFGGWALYIFGAVLYYVFIPALGISMLVGIYINRSALDLSWFFLLAAVTAFIYFSTKGYYGYLAPGIKYEETVERKKDREMKKMMEEAGSRK